MENSKIPAGDIKKMDPVSGPMSLLHRLMIKVLSLFVLRSVVGLKWVLSIVSFLEVILFEGCLGLSIVLG